MDKKYFDIKDTLYDITEKYEEAKDLLISAGIDSIADEKKRQTVGKAISLEMALKMKKVNVETFSKQLTGLIEAGENTLEELADKTDTRESDIKVEGILPCPVRVPLMESFQEWMKEYEKETDLTIGYELKAASMGVDWLKDSLERSQSADVLADIFISAGFDLFFDKDLIGKYKSEHVFEDITKMDHYNKDFENDYMSLKDPEGEYSMIGVVPAVFLVNSEELNGRKMPMSWDDILSEEFENAVSLPIGDFDLFNAILLNIQNRYGDEGVKKLGKSLLQSMHPSEMVKSHVKKSAKPVVTIMPYFFTKMTKRGGPMKAVWPKDGAIISPIFMLTKKEGKEKLKPIADFFSSVEVGEILSHNGRFPSVNPGVDNMISSQQKYMWYGWDNIKKNDIGKLIKRCEKLFHEAVQEV